MTPEEVAVTIQALKDSISHLDETVLSIKTELTGLRSLPNEVSHLQLCIDKVAEEATARWQFITKTIVGMVTSLIVTGIVYLLRIGV